MAQKYKVGDRVRIKSIDWYNENKDEDGIVELSTHIFTPGMSQFCGKVVTIEDVFEDIDDNGVYYMEEIDYDWTDEMIECKVEDECPQDFIEKYCRSCGTQRCDRTKEYLNGCPYYNAYRCKKQNNDMEELKFKTGDRVFNKVTRKWVNIIEFDIETGLYIVRYDDGIQGRSLESELRFMEEKSKSHNNMCKQLIDEMNPNVEVNVKTKPEPKFKRGDFVFSGIDFCAMKVIDRCYDEHWRYRIFDDVNEYWLFEKELKKVEIGDVVYSKVWKEKVIVRDFCDDKFILVADFNGKLLKSLPSLIKQIKEETKPKSSNTVSIDKAAEVFAEMLVELCPELLGFGGAAKEWENEFRKRLEE